MLRIVPEQPWRDKGHAAHLRATTGTAMERAHLPLLRHCHLFPEFNAGAVAKLDALRSTFVVNKSD